MWTVAVCEAAPLWTEPLPIAPIAHPPISASLGQLTVSAECPERQRKTRQVDYLHGLYQSFSNPNASFWSANNLLKARFPRAVKLSTASTLIAITIAISGLVKPSILRRITACLCRSGNCNKAAVSAADRAFFGVNLQHCRRRQADRQPHPATQACCCRAVYGQCTGC